MSRLATAKAALLLLLLSLMDQTASARHSKCFSHGRINITDVISSAVRSAVNQSCCARPEQIPHTSRCLSVCPEGFTACAGQCYSLQHTRVDYETAERRCTDLNSTLAIPRTRADNLCVAGLSDGQQVWLGITDRQQEGVFLAADGTPLGELDGHRWRTGEPNDMHRKDIPDGEDCVMMREDVHGAWNDMACHKSISLMCQLLV